uniref:Uncharacterized protein n=1 Tax=Octopus bimaculoides TaxID=37653 RepID=A0A0L8FLT8_OCTBM
MNSELRAKMTERSHANEDKPELFHSPAERNGEVTKNAELGTSQHQEMLCTH